VAAPTMAKTSNGFPYRAVECTGEANSFGSQYVRPHPLNWSATHRETGANDGGTSFNDRPHGADNGADEQIGGGAAAL
jgi:hypothetical protein